jgi:hypothetical protein
LNFLHNWFNVAFLQAGKLDELVRPDAAEVTGVPGGSDDGASNQVGVFVYERGVLEAKETEEFGEFLNQAECCFI